MLDLSTLDTVSACNTPAEVELKHPVTRKPLGIFVSVLGRDSDAFRNHLRETINDDLRAAHLAKKRGKQEDIATVEKGEQRSVELLVICTVSWRTGEEKVIQVRGEKLPCTVANAKRLYEEMPWIRNQVDEAIGDLENFMKV